MCGIAGLVGTPNGAILGHFADALAHRGPDGQGAYRNGACALVHTRLAIVDLQTGDQPFVARRANGAEVALIANGEIYNNPELRAELLDVDFSTRSDCEPPLHLYLKHGVHFATHLRGMYAIAIWDSEAERLILARDPFGIKPLYYAHTPSGFAFASEPRALMMRGMCEPSINPHKRDEMLQLQFTTRRETIYQGVFRVLPGETMVVERGSIVDKHIRPALPGGPPRSVSHSAAQMELDDVLNDTVGVHQRADVPYGMFLSGGIDSSVLLAMMSRLNDQPVVAFTAGFRGTTVPDEREHARALAHAEGAKHIEVEFGADDLWSDLPKIALHMDDPVADYAALPTWKLAKKVHEEGLKVVLSGEGGDELFAGYGRYRTAKRWLFPKDLYRKGIFDGLGVLKHEDRAKTWRSDMAQCAIDAKSPERTRLQEVQAQDIASWLAGDLMTKVDRMLMAHGVEGRVPFLDPAMAAFAFALPDHLKIHKQRGKMPLRHWLSSALPRAKPFSKKRGFSVPVGDWISQKNGLLAELVAKQNAVQELFTTDGVHAIFRSTDKRAGKAAWTLLFYALWYKIHMDGVGVDGDVFDILAHKG